MTGFEGLYSVTRALCSVTASGNHRTLCMTTFYLWLGLGLGLGLGLASHVTMRGVISWTVIWNEGIHHYDCTTSYYTHDRDCAPQ